jgi:hypothetical protein
MSIISPSICYHLYTAYRAKVPRLGSPKYMWFIYCISPYVIHHHWRLTTHMPTLRPYNGVGGITVPTGRAELIVLMVAYGFWVITTEAFHFPTSLQVLHPQFEKSST